MAVQLIEAAAGTLILLGAIRLWIEARRHATAEDVRQVLGESLALKSGYPKSNDDQFAD